MAKKIPETSVDDWSDIDRLDVRPNKGVIKIRCRNGWELQVDSYSGELLSSAIRGSDFIESIHDGSYFSESAKLWVFLPNGIALLVMLITGIYLWFLPIAVKWRKKFKHQAN